MKSFQVRRVETDSRAPMGMTLLAGIFSIPTLILELGTIVYAIAKWQRHPTISMMVVVASGIHLMTRTMYMVTPYLMDRIGMDRSNLMMAMSAVSSLLGLIAGVLTVMAIFSGRSTGTEAPVQRW